ncbi:MAG: T9SS type A sorting domain-containing protein [Hymenobacteraceae bacterium]|nr:T9SS type A sorting domain-containing protein [Hymenobacteraceae bacterium]MDX5395357.1 T9SS type A sorting domain-containing protein [Hymenobacteraceae bacterium]MDX5443270.1 T9SS type A sorting domain-containing protein [Hymenobacteraceae bacterium]MDX5511408.1 T9SS type A sorting domain-containing protein [Hymenobacteraceae bacterium]
MKIFTKILALFVLVNLVICANSISDAKACAVSGTVVLAQSPVSVSVYPNPSRGITQFMITQNNFGASSAMPANFRIRISNTIGKVVKVIEAKDFRDATDISVDLSEMPAGIYFYSLIINDKTVETKRLILQQ